ncbi:hypothetical protein KDH_66200 [Dictyobacter sp. S3.2.2.5]|uniref:Uncharacterized protein n=1 Tax=Dictyobacter halimunensis TaxID=3026934 RepID=A0ABQ6FZV4_9CHLR|nr:hypothetical protein KDH_66200 [Dictyobacter sp. S3.2.2.5]
MAQFDQRGQHVTQQYNAGRDINFGQVQNSEDLIMQLEQLKGKVAQAQQAGTIEEEQATDVHYQLTKAVQQARKPDPDKKTLLNHLTTAKSLIEEVAAASGLVTALVGAIEAVQKLFS